MTKLERLLKYKKFYYIKTGEDQFEIKFFKHSFLLVEDKESEYTISIKWDSESKLSKQETKKAFIQFVKLLKTYKIKYVLGNLNF